MYSTILKTRFCFVQHNLFHTSTSQCQKNRQLAAAFIKMSDKFGQSKGKRKKEYFAANVSRPDAVVKSIIQEKRKRFVRRENTLNKVFMSHITDFLSSGKDVSEQMLGKGFEISNVKVSPDFQILYIFWTATEEQLDNGIQELLDTFAAPIRDQLSQLRVVGNVPKIIFVKDKYRSKLADINNILNKADYGEDFQPKYPSLLNTDHMKLSNPESAEKMALEDLNEMPPMRNDVFNVDHKRIMEDIEKAVQKSKALHRTTEAGLPIILGVGETATSQGPESENQAEPPVSFVEYMKSQKILRTKLRKEKLAELIELEGQLTDKLASRIDEDKFEEDYFDEDSDSDDEFEYRR
uniref:Ribosome-binding factor A, mitochondrial n=1 Tax=Cacopsylla melanoneura TaxID=428564 RepID=A0A8D9DWN9_9HEMI